jgi:hypothetical protein
MRSTFDLPAVLLNEILSDPDGGEHWHALADWLWLHGRGDESDAVRLLWPALRDNLVCATLDQTLADLARNADVLAAVAREIEEQAEETPTDE